MVVQGLFVALSLLGLAAADARAIEHAVTVGSRVSRGERTRIERDADAPGVVVQHQADPPGSRVARAPDGFRLSARERPHAARRSSGRPPRRRSLSLQYLRRGLRQPRRRLSAAAGARDSGLARRSWPRQPRSRSCRCISRRGRDEGLAGLTVAAADRRSGGSGLWLLLPPDYLIARAAPALENERLIARSEGLTEVVAVTEAPSQGRTLLTNGHPMSSTSRQSQRYMRALAHVPLLSIDRPEAVLVIGFGVGNTAHAATLHPSIRRVEVADLSEGILEHAGLFQRGQPGRAERPARGCVRERRTSSPADAAAGVVRPHHARAAAHWVRRRGRAVFHASSTRWPARASSPGGISASGCRPIRCRRR